MLIRDTDTLVKYAQINGTWRYDSLEASLRMVELKYIIPIISQDLYDVLNTAITAATEQDPLNEDFVNLLHQCRMAIGPLFCYFHADKADVIFTESGMQRSETATSKNAYQEQRSKFKEANLTEGEFAMELLQQFIEKNQEDYPEWLDSDNFKNYKSLFIKSGAEFSELFKSQSTPYRNYWSLRAQIYDVEQNNIKKFLGKDLFNTLKTEDAKKDPVFTDEQKDLLAILKKAIANLSVAFAVPFLNVRIGSNGLTVPAVASFSQDDTENTRAGIDHKMIDSFITSCTTAGTKWLDNAATYITDNKVALSTWVGFITDEDCDTERLDSVFGMN